MSPNPILRRVHACVLAGVPAFLWGKPGTGKTQRVLALGRATERHVQRWLLSRCEPIDIKPRVYHEGKVIVCDPPEIDQLVECARAAKGGIMFMDELNLATRETESAALDKIDAPLDGIAVIAAGNPICRGQAARSLGAPAANRFCHLDVEADAAAWARAQISGWPESPSDFPKPEDDALEAATNKTRMLASSFIQRMPDLLEKCPDDSVQAGRGWPSTRTWEFAVKVRAVAVALGYDVEDQRALLAGCVGEAAAVAFLAFCADADLVDPEAWLKDPTGILPDRIDRTVAALTAVAYAVQTKLDEPRWIAAWQILGHVETSNQLDAAMVGGDLVVAMYRDLAKRDPTKVKTLTPPAKLMAKYAPKMATLLGT